MNKEEKAAAGRRDRRSTRRRRGDLRGRLPRASASRRRPSCAPGCAEADATFRVVKNRLAKRAAERPAPPSSTSCSTGPTALTFVKGDAVIAAKAIATFARQHDILEYKGGLMDGEPLDPEQFRAIARLPGLDVLHGQLVGVAASPLTGLTRGLASMISGLAVALGADRRAGPGRRAETSRGARRPPPRRPRRRGAPPRSRGRAGRGGREAEEPAAEEEPEAEARPQRGGSRDFERSRNAKRLPRDPRPRSIPRIPKNQGGKRVAMATKAMSTEEWIEELKNISVLELSERIKALEEEFGVSATAVAAAAPAAGRGRGRGRRRGGVDHGRRRPHRLPATRRSR